MSHRGFVKAAVVVVTIFGAGIGFGITWAIAKLAAATAPLAYLLYFVYLAYLLWVLYLAFCILLERD